jgi:hypothetical protein
MSGWHFFGYLKLLTVEPLFTRKWFIAIFFSGGDWRLFGGKRTSLDGYQLWVNAAC